MKRNLNTRAAGDLVSGGVLALGFAVLVGAGCSRSAEPSAAADGQAPGEAAEQPSLALVAGPPAVHGQRFSVGIDLAVPPGWHTYWVNPGETGMAPSFRWTLPDGVRFVGVQYPVPQRFEDEGIVSFGYEGRPRLLAAFEVDAAFGGQSVELALDADWMICKDLCLPVSSRATVLVPVAPEGSAGAADPLRAARSKLPVLAEGWRTSVVRTSAGFRLTVAPPEGLATGASDLTGAHVFATRLGALDAASPALLAQDGAAWSATLVPGPAAPKVGERFDAVVARPGVGNGWMIAASVEGSAP